MAKTLLTPCVNEFSFSGDAHKHSNSFDLRCCQRRCRVSCCNWRCTSSSCPAGGQRTLWCLVSLVWFLFFSKPQQLDLTATCQEKFRLLKVMRRWLQTVFLSVRVTEVRVYFSVTNEICRIGGICVVLILGENPSLTDTCYD